MAYYLPFYGNNKFSFKQKQARKTEVFFLFCFKVEPITFDEMIKKVSCYRNMF